MLLFDLLILAAVAAPPAIATPASDIRPAWSADGALRYFGALHPDGRHEVMEQARDGDAWGAPRSSAINAGGAVKDSWSVSGTYDVSGAATLKGGEISVKSSGTITIKAGGVTVKMSAGKISITGKFTGSVASDEKGSHKYE